MGQHMTVALVLFLLAVLTPLFFASPRTAPWWLVLQALGLAWLMGAQHGVESLHAAVVVTEVLLLRGLIAPWLLSRSNLSRDDEHLFPSNLLTWMLAVGLIVLAFELAASLDPAQGLLALWTVFTSIGCALLLLASNDAPAAQLFALLLAENAIVLFESLLPTPWAIPVHGALSGIYVLTVWVGTSLARAQSDATSDTAKQVL
jgi:hydrogenase-4 membrane subunit HyfE